MSNERSRSNLDPNIGDFAGKFSGDGTIINKKIKVDYGIKCRYHIAVNSVIFQWNQRATKRKTP